jgi:mannose-6-phosphate isomerase
MSPPYPLLFEPILKAKVWGGRRLARYGKRLPPDEPVGESWEVADLAATAPSGAGGGAARSVIVNGALAGRTLRDAVREWADDLIEPSKLARDGAFPLLVKFLDASDNLSVQVHPSASYAAEHLDAHLKTECWYVLEAEPDSRIYAGVKAGISADDFERDIRGDDVVDDLVVREARRGQMHLLPSGTVHALGAGVLVAEVQTPSDTTFRVYDWGRTEREIHVDQALEAMTLAPAPEPTSLPPNVQCAELVGTEHFCVDEIRVIGDSHPLDVTCCTVLMVVDGDCVLEAADDSFEPTALRTGTTVLVPRACGPVAALRAAHTPTVLCVRL